MPYTFNPFTGNLDTIRSKQNGTVTYGFKDKQVDSAFLINRTIELDQPPILGSELVFLNGLLVGRDCYTLTGSDIIFDQNIPFKVNHYIDIRYTI